MRPFHTSPLSLPLIYVLVVLGIFAACSTGKKHLSESSGVHFQKTINYDDILARSAAEHLPVVVYFTATWCGPCKVMDKYVFSDEELARRLNTEFISIKLDVDNPDYKDLVYIYDASALPTMVMVNQKGAELARRRGSLSISGVHRFLDEGLRALGD